MAKYVKQLGQEILYYKRDLRITIIDIVRNHEVVLFYNNEDYVSWDVIHTKLDPYLEYYIVGELSEPDNGVRIYISNIIP